MFIQTKEQGASGSQFLMAIFYSVISLGHTHMNNQMTSSPHRSQFWNKTQ